MAEGYMVCLARLVRNHISICNGRIYDAHKLVIVPKSRSGKESRTDHFRRLSGFVA
jgi:hypothetical protein